MKSSRRQLMQQGACGIAAWLVTPAIIRAARSIDFQLNYILASCLYGYESLDLVLPEVGKSGASAIDLWPKVHGDQREQLDAMGEEPFSRLLQKHDVELGCITQYKLGPFALRDEMRLAKRLGCRTIVTGAKGASGLTGQELVDAIRQFIEAMKPHLEIAQECGVTIAIENHVGSLIDSPEAIRILGDIAPQHLGIAFAPYHLPQDSELLSGLLAEVAHRVAVFYAWQHGHGCMSPLPKEEELLQLPGRGSLDFQPLLGALKSNNYQGWTEIFMHPFPRGIAIMDSVEAVTSEIVRARHYLDAVVSRI